MIERVLVPMDGSEMAERALRFALRAHADADVTVLHVVGEPAPFFGEAASLALADDPEEAANERAAGVFDRARDIAREFDADLSTEIGFGHPSRVILDRARDHDVVVMGSHGRDLGSRLLMGDVTRRVSRRSPVPVTVAR